MSLQTCPRCGQKRYDPWAGACERRKCGYEAPKLVFPDPEPVLKLVYDLLIELQSGWIDSGWCEICGGHLIPDPGDEYPDGHTLQCPWMLTRSALVKYRMVDKTRPQRAPASKEETR